jgi:hypothetical protein
MKRLFSFAIVALALAVGTSSWVFTTTESKARTKITVFKPGTQEYHESRMKMCNDNIRVCIRPSRTASCGHMASVSRIIPRECGNSVSSV